MYDYVYNWGYPEYATICGDDFGVNEADVICRMIGTPAHG